MIIYVNVMLTYFNNIDQFFFNYVTFMIILCWFMSISQTDGQTIIIVRNLTKITIFLFGEIFSLKIFNVPIVSKNPNFWKKL